MTFYKKKSRKLEIYTVVKDAAKRAQIYIQRKKVSGKEADLALEMTKDYYEVGYIISGSRKIITPTRTYEASAGMVGITHPYIYHKSIAVAEEEYEYVLIRFTPAYVEPLIKTVEKAFVEKINDQTIFHFSQKSQKKILNMFLDMVEEYEKELPHREFILQGMLFRLLFAIYEERLSESSVIVNANTLTPPIMQALAYIETNFKSNPTLEEVAKKVGFSTAYFSRLFSRQMGMSYTEYLDKIKIKHVQILLTQTNKTIMEIAEETGYCHGNYLNAQFKKRFGMTPGQYRKKNKELI